VVVEVAMVMVALVMSVMMVAVMVAEMQSDVQTSVVSAAFLTGFGNVQTGGQHTHSHDCDDQ
jgi:hypothetical protein